MINQVDLHVANIIGPPNPATDEKALWSKGKRVRCHTPGLPKMPRGRARRSRATTRERIPHRQGGRRRPSRGTSRPTGKIDETWEGNPARLRVRGSIVPAAPQTSYSTFFKAGGRDLIYCTRSKAHDKKTIILVNNKGETRVD